MVSDTLAQQAYRRIYREILSGTLSAGSRVSEMDLSQRLNIGRMPIREAIRQFQSEGLMEQIPRRGTFVRRFSLEEILELYEFREAVEPFAVAKAVVRIDANLDDRSPFSRSRDGGKTWTYAASPFPPLWSGQRPVMMRLSEGPLLLVSFTGRAREHGPTKPVTLVSADGERRQVLGLFAALSFDEGKTWKHTKLIPLATKEPYQAPGGGYLSCVQTPDLTIHLINSRFYWSFNLAWLQEPMPGR